MAVRIGSASINELGELEGGQLGDQNGKEVYIQDWYLHKKGWVVIRAIDATKRQKIAQDMTYICKNNNVGYSYWDNCYGLLNESRKYGYDASKVTVKCDTNCAKSVVTSIRYAGINVDDFNTGNEADVCRRTNEFAILTDKKYCESSDYLMKGDILVTKTKGHTVIVLDNGPKAYDYIPHWIANCAYCNLRTGPSINYAAVKVLENGAAVRLLGWAQSGWGEVVYTSKSGEYFGYISPLYLKEFDVADVAGDTWLRDAPGKNVGKQIVVVPKGSVVYLTGGTEPVSKTTWYQIIFDSKVGWSSGLYVKPRK